MANKEVHVGDDWYLDENNDGDLIFYNSRKDEIVKAIDVITGAEDKKSKKLENIGQLGVPGFISGNKEEGYSINKLLRAQLEETTTPSTPPSGYKELFTKSSGLAHVLDDAGNETPLLGQAGSPTWANRTYEGLERIDTPTTYTIGSGEDYTNLESAANDLRGLALAANVTLKLTENISDDNQVTFVNLLSMGGKIIIELNGKTWIVNSTASAACRFHGPFICKIMTDLATGGTIKTGNSTQDATLESRYGNTIRLGAANTVDLDLAGNNIQQRVYMLKWSEGIIAQVSFTDSVGGGSESNGNVKIVNGVILHSSVTHTMKQKAQTIWNDNGTLTAA